ncbi:MAG: hypothetical protein K2H01_02050 [Ruminococcus sp.]|nr:hypothetical protein [Ruminococcus sp.]
MLKIEKFVTMSPAQYEIIMEGMRNPKNSWERSDSYITHDCIAETVYDPFSAFPWFMGDNDHKLAKTLADGGPVHAKYRRMMVIYLTVTAPLYWWKEFDTYKVGTVANSCSTMHKIHEKEFTLDDFSHEHLFPDTKLNLERTISDLNLYRNLYLNKKDKRHWWQMIQLLPSSYNQKRTVMLNYEVLANIYEWRRDHKLDEWHTFCDWIESLPYSDLITGNKE